jgi:hypothetical protein
MSDDDETNRYKLDPTVGRWVLGVVRIHCWALKAFKI